VQLLGGGQLREHLLGLRVGRLLGADDYITKPFKQMELLARIKTQMRKQTPVGEEAILVCGALRFDAYARQLLYGNKEINLTATESLILGHLMRNTGHIVTHSSLGDEVWGEYYPGAADSLKVHIRRLREKIEADPSHPQLILTKPGIGYFMAKPD